MRLRTLILAVSGALALSAAASLPASAGPAPAMAAATVDARAASGQAASDVVEVRHRDRRHWRRGGRHGSRHHWRPRGRSGIFLYFGVPDTYVRPRYVRPRYVRPGYARPGLPAAHVRWCDRRYKTYRAWDNTFQPYHGPRKACRSPYY
ncbi:BA14K family protein [Aquibium sp. A9E412]|uniref:BA14K family protein n=1 Tax=Aquibium sp. A9E412 TaxID=2976767 RepID=UPI0025AF8C39|nr:BA14K family protein [Aquibium sp. A9E412]MDN2566132.1 BA14K family protein [Aquibium sp. A9E412]